MPEWVTQTEAAAILGCHVSNIPKLLRKGILTSRKATRRSLPSIDRGEVEAWADRRSRERDMRASRPRARINALAIARTRITSGFPPARWGCFWASATRQCVRVSSTPSRPGEAWASAGE
jgi:hypothetical protein